MTLAELLQELRENILHDRSHRVDGADDHLWSDRTLVRYIDEAQRRLAREGLVIWDGVTPEVTQVTLEPEVSTYTLHPSIIAVLSARLSDSERVLVRTGHSGLAGYQPPTHAFFGHPDEIAARAPGRPIGFTTDQSLIPSGLGPVDSTMLRLFPSPAQALMDEGVTIQLRVVRLPLRRLTLDHLNAELEAPSEHHIELLDWAAYLALRIADIDAGMPQRAVEFRASFEDVVTKARKFRLRRMMAPNQWAFGRNGYVWER